MKPKRWKAFLALSVLSALVPGSSWPSPGAAEPLGLPQVQSPSSVDPGQIARLVDSAVEKTLKETRIPGGVVVVVQGGRVIFGKGYGFADLDSRRAPSPQTTAFRVASLSKLVTTMAVLQQVERGALDLRQDVSHYLSAFKIEPAFGKPVTVADLLTHTGGFDERYLGTAARTEAEQVPLERYLATRMPPRVLPPGEAISYSNHGMTLAGYLVERASGLPFEEYVEQQIFAPLGMRHSAFRRTPELAGLLATGYASGRKVPFDYLNDLPAAGLITTGGDIARFMNALLAKGQGEGSRVLGEALAKGMLERRFSHSPRLAGRSYGLFERIENGQPLFGHEGEVRGFASGVYLLPAQDLGIFIVSNENTPVLRSQVLRPLLDALLPPVPVAAAQPLAPPVTPTEDAAGLYRAVRYPHSTLDKLAVLSGLVAELRLTPAGPGRLAVDLTGSPPMTVREVEPGLFQREDRLDLTNGRGLALHRDAQGQYDLAFIGEVSYERLSWYESMTAQRTFCALFGIVFLAALVASRWRRRSPENGPSRRTALLQTALGFLNLLLLLGVGLVMALTDSYEFSYGVPFFLKALLLLPFVTIPLAFVLPVAAVRSWRFGTPAAWRIHDGLVLLAGLLFIPFIFYWNMLISRL